MALGSFHAFKLSCYVVLAVLKMQPDVAGNIILSINIFCDLYFL